MVDRHGQFSIYFKALMGEPETGFPAGFFEGSDPLLDHFRRTEHIGLVKSFEKEIILTKNVTWHFSDVNRAYAESRSGMDITPLS